LHVDSGKRLFDRATNVELSLIDRQLSFAIDGEAAILSYPFSSSELPRAPTSRPLAIGSRGLGLEVGDLRVLRDIYYTHPRGIFSRWALDKPYQLRDDEYFVLGDNSPLSEDSRFWTGGPGVRASLLVGKPLVVHLPSRLTNWGWGPFNVPDLSAIRYIR
jgi:signal peptidase I